MAISIPAVESVLARALELFKMEFMMCPEIAACAPGRVNLIGEHTDYNDGFVLPMVCIPGVQYESAAIALKGYQKEALPMVTIIAGKANGTDGFRISTYTTNDVDEPHKIEFSIRETGKIGKPKWANYIKGVIEQFREATVPGFDAIIFSSVPPGGGLSSSAALEVATITFLEVLTTKKTTSNIAKAQICQKVECIYAGVPCGIMDQLASIYGQENQALLIDCRTLEITFVLLDDPELAFLITNSNVKHELSGSEYSIRRKQCEEAASILGKKSLRDVDESDLLNLDKITINKTVVARARHVVTENKRTLEGAKALQEKNYIKFGKLMLESHYSLRDDFEVSCKELDEIVEASLDVPGVYGSRMTGGGFGGCTVALVRVDAVEHCIANIRLRYSGEPVFYLCKPWGGAKPLTVDRK